MCKVEKARNFLDHIIIFLVGIWIGIMVMDYIAKEKLDNIKQETVTEQSIN